MVVLKQNDLQVDRRLRAPLQIEKVLQRVVPDQAWLPLVVLLDLVPTASHVGAIVPKLLRAANVHHLAICHRRSSCPVNVITQPHRVRVIGSFIQPLEQPTRPA